MKKLYALLMAGFFLVVVSGSALADNKAPAASPTKTSMGTKAKKIHRHKKAASKAKKEKAQETPGAKKK